MIFYEILDSESL